MFLINHTLKFKYQPHRLKVNITRGMSWPMDYYFFNEDFALWN